VAATGTDANRQQHGTTMIEAPKRFMFSTDGVAAPLCYTVFRRIWLASLLSNLGLNVRLLLEQRV
jgi:hypothetical protein